jgi:membrane protease YdiL (CAAX protease family)
MFWPQKVMMSTTSASSQVESPRYPRIASSMHMIAVIVIMGGWAFWQKTRMDRLGGTALPNRALGYVVGICFEWVLFAAMLAGLSRHKGYFRLVLGDRWSSVRQILRDIGIAVAFWIVASALLWVIGRMLQIHGSSPAVVAALPHGALEVVLWILLSVSAGICEEAVFRGYFQVQFMALTRNATAGILLSAALFGAVHAYQGYKMVILIAAYGAMFGCLSYWRGSVRPGMIAHAWQDSLSGVLGALARH